VIDKKAGVDCIDDYFREGLLDSSGTFTLSVAESCAKLHRYQLQPGLFFTKWVQAAVTLGCEKIRIDFAPTLTLTMLGQGSGLLRVEALLEHLKTPLELASGSPESSILLGILASQEPKSQALTLHLKDPAGGLVMQVRAGEVRAHPTPGAGLDWSLQVSLSESYDLRDLLNQRCGYCPVPLVMDEVPLESPWGRLKPEEFHIAEAYLESEGPARLRLPRPDSRPGWCQVHGRDYQLLKTPHSQIFLLSYPAGATAWDTALALTSEAQAASQVHWVKAGVIIESERVDLGTPGVLAVASAHYLQTDLSQFTLRRDEAYQARLALLREQAFQLLRKAKGCNLPLPASGGLKSAVEAWFRQHQGD